MFEIGDLVSFFGGKVVGVVKDITETHIVVYFERGKILRAVPKEMNNLKKIDKSILLALPEAMGVFVGNIDFDKTVEDLEKDLRTRVLVNEFSQKRLDLLKAVRIYLGKGEVKLKIEE